ncbi:MAG: hypothetical protein D6B26_00790 [Spirochaetaceae bacterium]|nr:MAG: hypothetical protein D6B26_00790 [Spirochaetaceae bacterium]
MDISAETKRAVSALFGDYDDQDEITQIRELPGISPHLVEILEANDHVYIEDLVALSDGGLETIEGLSEDDIAKLKRIVAENVEIVEDEYQYPEADATEDEVEAEQDDIDSEEPIQEEYEDEEADDDIDEADDDSEEIEHISELPGVTAEMVSALAGAGIDDIVDLIDVVTSEPEKLEAVEGLSDSEIHLLKSIISDAVEIIDEEAENEIDD